MEHMEQSKVDAEIKPVRAKIHLPRSESLHNEMGKRVGASICSYCNEKDQLFTFGSLLVLLRRLENVYAPLTFTLIISIRSAPS